MANERISSLTVPDAPADLTGRYIAVDLGTNASFEKSLVRDFRGAATLPNDADEVTETQYITTQRTGEEPAKRLLCSVLNSIALLNGWTGILGFRVDASGFVHLEGQIDGASATNIVLGILPIGYRPSSILNGLAAPVVVTETVIPCTIDSATGEIRLQYSAGNPSYDLNPIIFKIG